MLDKLPKPLLFGFCGAIGGLLMALIPGELFFFLLRPPYVQVQLGIPKEVVVYPGGKNFIEAKLPRNSFTGTVRLEAVDPPDGITVEPVKVASDAEEGKVYFQVADGVAVGDYSVRVRAKAGDSDKVFGEGTLIVRVEKAPPAVLLNAPRVIGGTPGGSTTYSVVIKRSQFEGPVHVGFKGLPSGLTGTGTIIPANEARGKVKLDVDPKLKPRKKGGVRDLKFTTIAKAAEDESVVSGRSSTTIEIRKPSADIVFVVDITASMGYAIEGINKGVAAFAQDLAKKNIDVRLAFVGFRDRFDPPPSTPERRPDLTVLKFGDEGEPFTRSAFRFANRVGLLRAVGGGDFPEDSYYGVLQASELPFRQDAAKVFVLITDAKPRATPLGQVPTLKQTIAAVKDAKIDQIHLLVHSDIQAQTRFKKKNHLPFYQPLQQATTTGTGLRTELDLVANEKIDFAKELLPNLGKQIVNIVGSTKDADVPPPPSGVAQAPDSGGVKGVQSTGEFAKKDRWRLLLAVAWWTALIAGGISIGILQGQHYDLQRRWLAVPDMVKALGAGFLAGFVGGALGQLLFTLGGGSVVWDVFGRILGWTLLGALVGLGVTLFAPNLSKLRGLAGGALGGLSAALVFLLISLVLGALLGSVFAGLFGRWIGAAILGFLIGLMVALADVLFRRYWLEIAFGRREIRTVTLGAGAITLGSDEGRVAVFVPDAPPIALRYWMDGDVVVCEEVQNRRTSELAPGNVHQLAGVTIKVCSVDTVESSGLVLELSTGGDVPLSEGMPLTADDLPGLQPKGTDGIVALLSPRPADPTTLLLRNRSVNKWIAVYPDGRKSEVGPGFSVEAVPGIIVHFAQGVHGRFAEPEGKQPQRRKAVRSQDTRQHVQAGPPRQQAIQAPSGVQTPRPPQPPNPVPAQPMPPQHGQPIPAQPVQAQPVQAQPVPAQPAPQKVGAECPGCQQYIEGTPGRRYCERCGRFF